MKFNGSAKQQKWATEILNRANLTDEQVDNLLRFAGPTMHSQGIMDSTIVIENRDKLAAYADSLGRFYQLSKDEKREVAAAAAGMLRETTKANMK